MLYKKSTKKAIFTLLLIMVLTVVMNLCVKAQDPGGGGDPNGDPDSDVPLDPGSWVLVAAGVGYGVKKWRDSKQKANDNTSDFINKDK
jgi:hypothetical protein